MKTNYHHFYRKYFYSYFTILFILVMGLLFTSCADQEPIDLNFAFGAEDSGTLAAMIKTFNDDHQGEIKVNWQEAARTSNDFYREIEKDFALESPGMDIIAADVVWTSAFAQAGWIEDLSQPFYDDYHSNDFIEAGLNSTIYQSKMWGMPWYTDAGMLYYRKDLLAANGFDHPPATWEELRQMAKTVMETSEIKYGYVFQGANYEGGVVNACEFIWNAGGNMLISDLSVGASIDEASEDVNIITVNSEAAKLGLYEAYEMINSGISPAAVSNFKELESITAFANGDAVFMRNWPTAYAIMQEPSSVVKPEQIAVAPLPVSKVGMESFSCLGGWNLMINSRISEAEKEAAWTFIRFMTDRVQQERLALRAGTLPSLRALYEDEQLLARAPMIQLAKEVIKNTRVRPITPKYMLLSPDMAWTFHEVLKGSLNPTEAVETMQGQMEGALAVN